MAERNTEFEMANYDGGFPPHPEPEPTGRLVLTTAGKWELHYGGKGAMKRKRWIHGGWDRYPLTAVETGPTSCHVWIGDVQDPSVTAGFALPKTSAAQFTEAFDRHRASLGAKVAQAQELQEKVESGAWWLRAGAFKGLGFTETLRVPETHYLGGWQGHEKTYTGKMSDSNSVVVNKAGINYSKFKTVFTIPWEDIVGLEVEGPDQAQRRLTATRMVGLGVFALAAPKKSKIAILLVSLRNGDVAVFQTEKMTALELKGKLTPVSSQVNRAQDRATSEAPAAVTDQVATPPPPMPPPPPKAATPAPPPPGTPAGWLDDPTGEFEHRYWDGGKWTEHVSANGEQTTAFL